jgi:hypothetical protein
MSAPQPTKEAVALDRVRRRVTAIGFFAVASHGVFGLIGAAKVLVDQDRHGDAMLLLVMSAIVAQVVCSGTRAILGRTPFSVPWALLALVPTVAGFVWLA